MITLCVPTAPVVSVPIWNKINVDMQWFECKARITLAIMFSLLYIFFEMNVHCHDDNHDGAQFGSIDLMACCTPKL